MLDAASPRFVTGLWLSSDGQAAAWRETHEEAGVGLFRTTEDLLHAHGLKVTDLRTVIFCDGPGSLLGIRLVAMTLRTWMALPREVPLRLLTYRSLALVAADRLNEGAKPPFHVCSDARRNTWNLLHVTADGAFAEIQRCPAEELPHDGGPLFHPDPFPHWQALPAGTLPAPYRPEVLPALIGTFPLLRETTAPDAFMIELPTYRTWSAIT